MSSDDQQSTGDSSLAPGDHADLLLAPPNTWTPSSPDHSNTILVCKPETATTTTLQAPCLRIPNYVQDLVEVVRETSKTLSTVQRRQAAIANHSANIDRILIEKRCQLEDVEARLHEWGRLLTLQDEVYEQRLVRLEEREARSIVTRDTLAEQERELAEKEMGLRELSQDFAEKGAKLKKDSHEQQRQRAHAPRTLRPRKKGKATRALKACLADTD